MINGSGDLVTTQRMDEKVEVFLEGEKIAETNDAIVLFEEGYDPVFYIPKNDVTNIDLLKTGDYDCPHKGHAELYTIVHGSGQYENAAWTYDEPFNSLAELKGRVAFYRNRVDEIRISA